LERVHEITGTLRGRDQAIGTFSMSRVVTDSAKVRTTGAPEGRGGIVNSGAAGSAAKERSTA
jgi:hypothetical protein